MDTIAKRFKYRILGFYTVYLLRSIEKKIRNGTKLYPDPFFIIGSGRNGSTLLAAILNNHSKLFLPPEQWTLAFSIFKWYFSPFLTWENKVEKIINDFESPSKTLKWKLDSETLKRNLISFRKENRIIENLISSIFLSNTINTSKIPEKFGDQSPITTHYVKLIKQVYQKSKFIFLLRDARDVILSYSKLKNHKANEVSFAIWKWNDSIKIYDWLTETDPSSVILTKYENLVKDPSNEIQRILHFLGYKYEEGILESRKQVSALGVENLIHHQNLKRKISTDSIGKWRAELDPSLTLSIMPKLERNLNRFGYIID